MMKLLAAALLLSSLALASAYNIRNNTRPCTCINPFRRTRNAWLGDPDTTCPDRRTGRGGASWGCYVSCSSDCSDMAATASTSR